MRDQGVGTRAAAQQSLFFQLKARIRRVVCLRAAEAGTSIYRKTPHRLRQLISADESARDVIAVSHRRSQLQRFRRLLKDDAYIDAEVDRVPGQRREAVWQRFFEDNPWVLGVPLTGQLLTSWSDQKLEQVVAGVSIRRGRKTC